MSRSRSRRCTAPSSPPMILTAIRSSCFRSARRNSLTGTVLITGAAGFVGQGRVAHLTAEGRPVRRAVRAGDADGSIAVGDIGPDTDWARALEGVDTVVLLAGRA